MAKNTLFVNFFGGPSVGKSTLASHLSSAIAFEGVDCIFVPEFAKERFLVGDVRTLQDQAYVTSTQRHRCWIVNGLYDVAVTDSPFLMGLLYGKSDEYFKSHILNQFNQLKNINIVVRRTIPFIQCGREQNEEESIEKDKQILAFLQANQIPYIEVDNEKNETTSLLRNMVINILKGERNDANIH